MARAQVPFFALNAGEVGSTALARIDLEKMRMAAESMINFIPSVLGPMSIRPGTEYIGSTYGDESARLLPFVFNASTTSLIEITGTTLRVRNGEALVVYPNVTTTMQDGTFQALVSGSYTRSGTTVTVTKASHGLSTGATIYATLVGGPAAAWYTITVTNSSTFTFTTASSGTITANTITYYAGWNDVSTTGASAIHDYGILRLLSTEYSYGRVRQNVPVPSIARGYLHCVKIEIARGPVTFRIGTTAGSNDLVSDQILDQGTHFIAFTPTTANIYLELEANDAGRSERWVTECSIYKNANLEIPTPWADADLNELRYAQSGSVVFLAHKNYPPYKIERRGVNSWSLARYYTSAGPYLGYSARKIKLKPSTGVTTGNTTMTADAAYFDSGMEGAIFEITHPGQRVIINFTDVDQSSDYIKVTGVNTDDRAFSLNVTVTGTATVTLERAYGVPEGWTGYATYTSTTSATIDDSLSSTTPQKASSNNLVVYYRLTVRSGSTFSGSASGALTYDGGSKTGVFRVLSVTNANTASVEILKPLGGWGYTSDWREGSWSALRSFPSSVALHDGRLWWAGLDKVYGSVSDDYYNFDPSTEGDAGPIVRSIATGPVEGIGWMLPLQRLLVGTASAEVSIRSSSFDEPLTPTAFTARNASTVGSASIQAVPVDSAGIYVQRNRTKVFELVYDVDTNDYGSREVTRLNQDICTPGVVKIAVQRQPDTRVWFVKSDGTLAMLLYDRTDSVVGWARVETDGAFESIAILPTGDSDDVYFVVRRTINGVIKRYIEKFNTASGSERHICDASYNWTSGFPTTSVSGLTHLAGKTVTVFSPNSGGFAVAPQTYTVSGSGTVTLSSAQTNLIIGLPFTAKFKTVKMAYGSAAGTALAQKKRIDHLALVGLNTVIDGVKIGRDFNNLTSMSTVYKGKAHSPGTLVASWDYEATSFNGGWDTDSRLCLQVSAPYPATVSGLVINMKTNDRG